MPSTSDTHLTHCRIDRESAAAIFCALGRQAAQRGITLRNPPPEPTTCCSRGCNGCVWEGYLDAASFWRDDALDALGTTDLLD